MFRNISSLVVVVVVGVAKLFGLTWKLASVTQIGSCSWSGMARALGPAGLGTWTFGPGFFYNTLRQSREIGFSNADLPLSPGHQETAHSALRASAPGHSGQAFLVKHALPKEITF
jgi:hypothetical protein